MYYDSNIMTPKDGFALEGFTRLYSGNRIDDRKVAKGWCIGLGKVGCMVMEVPDERLADKSFPMAGHLVRSRS